MMYLLILVLAALVDRNSALLQCYKCTGVEEESCLKNPSIEKCDGKTQGACMTLSYVRRKDNTDLKLLQKGCWDSFTDCVDHCRFRNRIRRGENCEVSCCTTDLCNKGGVVKPKLFQEKKKRSTGENNSAVFLTTSFTIVSVFISSLVLTHLSRNILE